MPPGPLSSSKYFFKDIFSKAHNTAMPHAGAAAISNPSLHGYR
jgi:hypothetical protein